LGHTSLRKFLQTTKISAKIPLKFLLTADTNYRVAER